MRNVTVARRYARALYQLALETQAVGRSLHQAHDAGAVPAIVLTQLEVPVEAELDDHASGHRRAGGGDDAVVDGRQDRRGESARTPQGLNATESLWSGLASPEAPHSETKCDEDAPDRESRGEELGHEYAGRTLPGRRELNPPWQRWID